ncbi:MAG: GlsB/YeaQ/YmgE family stress response membrane protein [Candidatus Limnocylindria bacterium]
MGLILFLLMGLLAGFIARALMPGPDPMGWLGTMVLGVVGSFIGGTLGALLFGGTMDITPAGLIGSIIGAFIALFLYRQMAGRRAAV